MLSLFSKYKKNGLDIVALVIKDLVLTSRLWFELSKLGFPISMVVNFISCKIYHNINNIRANKNLTL